MSTNTAEGRPAGAMPDRVPAAPRCAVLIGPYGTGKTSLLEAMLWISGTTGRLGRVADGTARGDAWPEARGQISGGLTLNTARIGLQLLQPPPPPGSKGRKVVATLSQNTRNHIVVLVKG